MAPISAPTGERRYDRVRTRLPVAYGLNSPAERSGFTESISEGGLYLNTNRVYKVGTRLRLEIEFPGRIVEMRGEVAWAIQVPEHLRDSLVCGMGVSFLDPHPGWAPFFRRWKESGGDHP